MFVLIVLLVCVSSCAGETTPRKPQYDELYASGVRAYFDGDFDKCIKNLEEAIQLYHFYNHALKECSELCNDETAQLKDYIMAKATCDQKCEERIFNNAVDTLRMNPQVDEAFKHRKPYTYLQYAYFKKGKVRKAVEATYTYLQHDPDDEAMVDNLDYYKSRDDYSEDMLIDLEQLPMMEAYKKGADAYAEGHYAAAVELLKFAVSEFFKEEGLCRTRCDRSYDVGAEYRLDTKRQHEQTNDHFQQVLECNLGCVNEVAAISKKLALINFLPELYNYMQFSYYQLGNLKEANRCAKSYLVFLPEDQTMASNLGYYQVDEEILPENDAIRLKKRIDLQMGLLGFYYRTFGIKADLDSFIPYKMKKAKEERKDVGPKGDEKNPLGETQNDLAATDAEIKEVEEIPEVVQKKESVDDELEPSSDPNPNFADGKLGSYKSWKEKTDDIIDSRDISNIRRQGLEREKRDVEEEDNSENLDLQKRLDDLNEKIDASSVGRKVIDSLNKIVITDSSSVSEKPVEEGEIPDEYTLLANSTQLGGPLRFALDGLAAKDQCRTLMDLELAGGKYGDGYYGNQSPHTPQERFQGLTLGDAIRQSERGLLPVEAVRLYDNISEEALKLTKSYFKLEKELYFDYTHLVCRTALKPKEGEENSELSHPIHGDNCLLNTDGSCEKKSPAYTWRDYSAIVYLNDDFDGGEFIMTEPTARQVTLEVKPKCGRLVSFSAGSDCLHGVKPVKRGRRCAVALWFTHDPEHDERKRIRQELAGTKYFSAERDEL